MASILEEAHDKVYGKRGKNYGDSREDWEFVGKRWTDLLSRYFGMGIPLIPPQIAALMMIDVKISRHLHVPKRDNLVDGAGYFEVMSQIEENRTKIIENEARMPKVRKTNGKAID